MDNAIDEASAEVTAILKDGRKEHVFVEHAIGSLENPLTDVQLEAKFRELADPVIGKDRADELIASCWKLGEAADVLALTSLARP